MHIITFGRGVVEMLQHTLEEITVEQVEEILVMLWLCMGTVFLVTVVDWLMGDYWPKFERG